MSLRPVKVLVQYLLGSCAITFFVALLTFIFSFLGTIFCAALAGMMLGAFKTLRWQSAALSFLFPGVIIAMLRGARADLPEGQILFLGAACFGTFWLTYGTALCLKALEQKKPIASSAADDRRLDFAAAVNGNGRGHAAFATTCPSDQKALSLGIFEGRWLSDAKADNSSGGGKCMEIKERELVLTAVRAGGGVNLLARCRVHLDTSEGRHRLVVQMNRDDAVDEFLISI